MDGKNGSELGLTEAKAEPARAQNAGDGDAMAGPTEAPKSALLRVGEPSLDLGCLDLPVQPDSRVSVPH